ncbi:unnamed protein product, partial [Brassica oleracea var. botrytis]
DKILVFVSGHLHVCSLSFLCFAKCTENMQGESEPYMKACSFQECTPLCLQKYNMDGICIGNNKNICTCIYNC